MSLFIHDELGAALGTPSRAFGLAGIAPDISTIVTVETLEFGRVVKYEKIMDIR